MTIVMRKDEGEDEAGPGTSSAPPRAAVFGSTGTQQSFPPQKGEHRPIQLNGPMLPTKGITGIFPDLFSRILGLSWETSALRNYHPEDSRDSGSSTQQSLLLAFIISDLQAILLPRFSGPSRGSRRTSSAERETPREDPLRSGRIP